MGIVGLESQRLWFRPYTSADLDFYASLWANTEVVRYIGDGKPKSRQEASQRLQRIIAGYSQGFGLMAVWHMQQQRLVGQAGLVQQTVEGRVETEIGYWLAQQYWGWGLATEAATRFRDYAFQELHLFRVIALIQQGNQASKSVARKIGMVYERDVTYHGRRVQLYKLE